MLVACLGGALQAAGAQRAPANVRSAASVRTAGPANAAAQVILTDSNVVFRYDGVTIFEARVSATRGTPRVRQLVDTSSGRITQVVTWLPGNERITLRGTAHAAGDAFAVDADPREDGVPIVRNSVGPSYSLLNRGVYARGRDWLLSVDFPSGCGRRFHGIRFSSRRIRNNTALPPALLSEAPRARALRAVDV